MASWNESKAFKNFMSKLYGIGAAVVIVGALFKIMHWPFAGVLLTVGLSTEAIIFFFSAFEKPHAEPDWSLVYPELAGMHDDDVLEVGGEKKKPLTEELDKMLEEAKIGPELIQSLGDGMRHLGENANKLSNIGDAAVATDGYVSNLTGAAEAVGQLKESYNKTTEAVNKEAATTEAYTNSLQTVTQKAQNLSQSFSDVSNIMKQEQEANADYLNNVKAASASAKTLAENYVKSAESITKSAEAIDFSKVDGQAYANQLQAVSQSLASLNSVYEMQLKGSNDYIATATKLTTGMETFSGNLQASTDDTQKFNAFLQQIAQKLQALENAYEKQLNQAGEYIGAAGKLKEGMESFNESLLSSAGDAQKLNQGVTDLAKNIAALNQVYGNMLTAMTNRPQF